MNTNWDYILEEIKTIIKDNVMYLGDALSLEEKITDIIEKHKRGLND